MIFGVGTDLVEIARLQRGLERWGGRFAERILHPTECGEGADWCPSARLLAKRFAAKEAAVKALGTGFTGGIGPCDIAVEHHPGGQPRLVFHAAALDRLRVRRICRSHLSLSDERTHVSAFVVLEQ
ncbi:MAG: holo-ACP synthase [Pseudomonadota bacterium]